MKRLQVLVAAFLLASALLPACFSAAAECSREDVFCVGLVTDIGKINDKSFNQSAWEGVQQAQRELGAQVQYIETADPRDYAKNIATFGEAGYDVIVTVGFSLGEATAAAAITYPEVDFIGVDQFQSTIIEGVAGLNEEITKQSQNCKTNEPDSDHRCTPKTGAEEPCWHCE